MANTTDKEEFKFQVAKDSKGKRFFSLDQKMKENSNRT